VHIHLSPQPIFEGPMYSNTWYGTREVFVVRQTDIPVSSDVMSTFSSLLPWRETEPKQLSDAREVYKKSDDPIEIKMAQRQLQVAIDEAQILQDETRRQHRPPFDSPPALPAKKTSDQRCVAVS